MAHPVVKEEFLHPTTLSANHKAKGFYYKREAEAKAKTYESTTVEKIHGYWRIIYVVNHQVRWILTNHDYWTLLSPDFTTQVFGSRR